MLNQLDATQIHGLSTGPDVTGQLPTMAPQDHDWEAVLLAKITALLNGMKPNGVFSAITPDDDTDLAAPTRSIYVGGAGDVAVRNAAGDDITFAGVPAGAVLPIVTSRVLETGTTATGLVAL